MQKAFYLLTKKYGYPKSFGEFIAKANQAYNQGGEERDLTQKYLSAPQKRKKILSGSQSKLETLYYIADAISASTSSLVFCENIESAETISTQLNEIRYEDDENYVYSKTYHSGMKNIERNGIIEDLAEDLDCIVAVHALDEGVDLPNVDCGVIMSSSSQKRQMIQRMGRVLRKKQDGR